ncbi:MAG: hypothetical protein BGO38_15705 [Cellulomonas sp. 73-145]|uniref:YciI family protein n=1 Tax=Cellulomonas sp. 73-145 TaxID=1895739 RepID=UPI000927A19F|nr:YciI family protein [Cellulomonas sp. 73-145]MBN9325502.1 hypothetical protein [Cellulomonas sp.]OJV58803.1 MAG: hypothetical protein BGO38_15705 [Cellulomonas sp. 73-145]
MKFLLVLHNNPTVIDALSAEDQKRLMDGHAAFIAATQESGELVVTQALADPSQTAVARLRDGVPAVTDGPFAETKEFLGGYYLLDVADRDRAVELARQVPDASIEGLRVEVRPVMFEAGLEM